MFRDKKLGNSSWRSGRVEFECGGGHSFKTKEKDKEKKKKKKKEHL